MNLRDLLQGLRREAPALLLPLAVLAVFVEVVAGREILWGDFVSWYFPSHHYAADRLSRGELPLWNPYNDCGMPFMGEADHGTLYPPSLLLHLVGPRKLLLFHALQAFTVAHLIWGALSLYALARSLGCRPWAAAAGGLAFGLSGTFMARAAHVSLICAQVWLPAAVGGLHHALRTGGRRPLVLAAAAIGMIALSGSPATAVVTVVGLAVTALGTAMTPMEAVPLSRRLPRAGLVLAGVVTSGLLLGAIQLLPMRELVAHSERSAYTYEQVADYSLTPDSLVMALLPRFYGWLRYDRLSYWGPENFAELSSYTGLISLLAVAASLRLVALRRTLPWIALAVTGLWLALGPNGGLHWLFYRFVPVLGEMRAPARFLLLWACGLSVLAALGIDALADGLRAADARARRLVAGAAVALVVLGIIVWMSWPAGVRLLDEWQDPVYEEGCRRALIALSASLLALLAAEYRPSLAGPVLAAALAFDLAVSWQGVGLHPYADIAQVIGPTPPYLAPSVGDTGLHRVASRFTNPGEMMMARVQTTSGPGRHLLVYQRYHERITSRTSALYDLLNVKYLAESVNAAVKAPGPNVLVTEGVWLIEGQSVDIPIDPPLHSDGVELMLTATTGDIPDGTRLADVELLGSDPPVVFPIRLGVETGDFGGGHPPTAATRVPVDHYVHVTDAGSLLRAHYHLALETAVPRNVSAVRFRHAGGPQTVVIKELRLFRSDVAVPSWRVAVEGEPYGDFKIRLHENLDVLPRAWIARRFILADSYERAWQVMAEGGLDLRHEVVIEPPAGTASSDYAAPPSGTAHGRASVTRFAPEHISVDAEAPAPGAWLVLSEVKYPGWVATIDGRPAGLARANALFRAVWVPPGRHEVRLRYRPASFYRGAVVSAVTALALTGLVVWSRRRTAVPA